MAEWPLFTIDKVAIELYSYSMDVTNKPQAYDPSVGLSTRIPFSRKEATRFRAYLKATGKKAGAFARTAILAAMAKDVSI